MEQAKYDQMQSMLTKLQDIKNSQESIIDKVNHVITDLFQNPNKELEKGMEELHQTASDSVERTNLLIEDYELKFNKLQQA